MNFRTISPFILSLATVLLPNPLHAGTYLSGPFAQCFDSGGNCAGGRFVDHLRESGGRVRPMQQPLLMPLGSDWPGGLLRLQGQLDGNWDQVDGKVVFTYDFSASRPDIGRLQVLIRSLPVQNDTGSNRYFGSWDRASYWLDFDGDGLDVPRLLPAQQLFSAYVPQAVNDPYPEFAKDENVTTECTAASPCTIQLSEYVQLREPGVDYSDYDDEAASADLLFVANRFGQAVATVLDVYDADLQFVKTKDLHEDDQLKLSVVGYKLSEPDSVYVIGYTEFVVLDESLRIELQNYIPGVDFQDSGLAPDLQAGQRRIKLLLEGYRDQGANDVWAFGGPYDLGFTWAQALEFLHQDGFETRQLAPNASPVALVRPRE